MITSCSGVSFFLSQLAAGGYCPLIYVHRKCLLCSQTFISAIPVIKTVSAPLPSGVPVLASSICLVELLEWKFHSSMCFFCPSQWVEVSLQPATHIQQTLYAKAPVLAQQSTVTQVECVHTALLCDIYFAQICTCRSAVGIKRNELKRKLHSPTRSRRVKDMQTVNPSVNRTIVHIETKWKCPYSFT